MKIIALTTLACASLIGFASYKLKHPTTGVMIPVYPMDANGYIHKPEEKIILTTSHSNKSSAQVVKASATDSEASTEGDRI